MKQVLLVRHRETEYNAPGRLQGSSPVSLSMPGRQQAGQWGPLRVTISGIAPRWRRSA
jgi:broad specificity phosphatase PhoE